MTADLELINYLESSPFYAGFDVEDLQARNDFFEKFRTLAPPVQDFLTSTTTADYLFGLAQQFRLDETRMIILAMTVRHIVTGDVSINNVPRLMATLLGIELASAEIVFEQINKGLFPKIINYLNLEEQQPFNSGIRQSLHEQNMTTDMPRATSGNVIDLRNQK